VKVGPIVITKQEFLNRYEMMPGINRRKNDIEGSKAEFLLSMIAEKLLILKARNEGWDNDSLVTIAVREVEKALVRDELYRKEVQQRITITEQEIAVGMRRALNDMKVYFLYARDERRSGIPLVADQQRKTARIFLPSLRIRSLNLRDPILRSHGTAKWMCEWKRSSII
jgi:hypothetical protein